MRKLPLRTATTPSEIARSAWPAPGAKVPRTIPSAILSLPTGSCLRCAWLSESRKLLYYHVRDTSTLDSSRDSTFQIGQLKYVAAVAALLLALTACGGDQQVLTWDQLENAAYPVEFAEPDGIAQLEGGEFRQQAAPGSATETVVRLAQVRSFGRIDNGSSIDAAPILIVDPGGSGTFIFLVAALNVDGHPEMAATTLLGDRVAVRSVRIVDSQIVVGMRVRAPDDPFAYLTTEVTRTYVLEGDELVLLSEEASSVSLPSPGDYGFTPERIEVTGGEGETVMGRLAPGELGDHRSWKEKQDKSSKSH